MKRFYSAESRHGSQTSHGFSNDIFVTCFSSKTSRDAYVRENDNISCKAIPACDVTRYATNYNLTGNETNAPRPFTGEYWAIVNYSDDEATYPDGFIGVVESIKPKDGVPESFIVERLYK